MSRIQLTDNTISAITKMSDGNPGAVTVLMELLNEGGKIDPDDFMGGLGSVLALDTLGIYGSSIWVLYKDVCGQEVNKMIAVLRSHQLGFISGNLIFQASDERIKSRELIDVDSLYSKVKERLPRFDNLN